MGNPSEVLREREELEKRRNSNPQASTDCQISLAREVKDSSREDGHSGGEINMKSNIIGASDYIKKLRKQIFQIAKSDVAVLIEGPTGTGKDLVAKEIHRISERTNIVSQNCAAIPRELFEAEMFGALQGAFSGANKEKKGLVEIANKGTLFLDEIGELSLEHQSKLLRFLDNFTYRKLGSNVEQKTNTRLIAATNRDLLKAIRKGTFRDDLYYRLSQHAVKTEPLKGKIEDVICLVNHFMAQMDSKRACYNPWSKLMLYYYTYPGNVRELKVLVGKNPDYIQNWVEKQLRTNKRKRTSYGMKKLKKDMLYFDDNFDSWKNELNFIEHDFSHEDEDNLALLSNPKLRAGLSADEKEEAYNVHKDLLEKRRRANDEYRNRVLEHGLKVFEILVLNQKAKLNTDQLHAALHMRYHSVQDIEEKYHITFPHGKDLYEITTPIQMLPKPEWFIADDELFDVADIAD